MTGRDLADVKVVLNGAGAAGIASVELIKAMGVRRRMSSSAIPRALSTAAAPRA